MSRLLNLSKQVLNKKTTNYIFSPQKLPLVILIFLIVLTCIFTYHKIKKTVKRRVSNCLPHLTKKKIIIIAIIVMCKGGSIIAPFPILNSIQYRLPFYSLSSFAAKFRTLFEVIQLPVISFKDIPF